jgi:NitT/TauT family transport system permease protein
MSSTHETVTDGTPLETGEVSLRNARILRHSLIFIVLIAMWEAGSRLGLLDPLFYPRPTNILNSLWLIYFKTGNVWYHLYSTMGLVVMGWIAGSILGVGLGALVGFNATIRRFIKPYIIVLEATPRINSRSCL